MEQGRDALCKQGSIISGTTTWHAIVQVFPQRFVQLWPHLRSFSQGDEHAAKARGLQHGMRFTCLHLGRTLSIAT